MFDGVFQPPSTFSSDLTNLADTARHASEELAVLSWVGGISTLAGIASLVITRGTVGMRAIVIGVCLVILNFAIANYLSWILIPALVGTGFVSLAWAYVTVKQLMKSKKE